MRVFRGFACFIVCVALAAPIQAQAPKPGHDITVDDYFTQAAVTEVAMAPDGRHVAYTDARWQEATDDRKADLWVVTTATRQIQRLTFDRVSPHSLKWSADNRWIYFLGNRKREAEKQPPYDGNTQVWRVAVDGGEPFAVTRVDSGVSLFDLTHDGRFVYYTTETNDHEAEWQDLRQKFGGIQYGHGTNRVSVVWRMNLADWRVDKVVDDKRNIREMALTPDANRLAMITTPDDTVLTFEGRSRVDVFDIRRKTLQTLPDKGYRADALSPYGWLQKLAWSADSARLAFTIIFDAYPAEIFVAEWDDGKPRVFKLQRPKGVSLRGYDTPLQWRGANELCFLGDERARVRLLAVGGIGNQKLGETRTLTEGDVVVDAFHWDAAGERAAVILGGPEQWADVFLVAAAKKPERLTRVNPQAQEWKRPQLSVVTWAGSNGDPVEGILELPPDYKPGQRVPLIVEIHGGPTTATYFNLQLAIYGRGLLPARGYAVLSPNYRGSTGYGDKFLMDLIGRENDIEVNDILKGVDEMIARGIADPERLGVMGWSNGGYLTNCLITHTPRFKAASSGASILDTVMEWGTNDEPAYPIAFKRGFPWNRADTYKKTSPTYQLDKIRTPTLIHVGGNDERCPPGHSRMLYRALKEYVKVPTQLLVYPGEPHGLMKYKNRKAKMEWDIAWFDRYLR